MKNKILDIYKAAIMESQKQKSISQPKQFTQGYEVFNDNAIYGKKSEKVAMSDRIGRKSFATPKYQSTEGIYTPKYNNSSQLQFSKNKVNP